MQSVEAIQRTLPDIDDVSPLSANDEPCLREVREVLERHGTLQRFGVTLLHEHFVLSDDEALVEFVDTQERTLTTRPVKRDHPAVTAAVQTSWRLDTGEALAVCQTWCYVDNKGDHNKKHS
jgi:hypothetical protein